MSEGNATIANTRTEQAIRALARCERGRDVLFDLRTLLQGRISGLDQLNWNYVITLLAVYKAGYPGTVLDQLGLFCDAWAKEGDDNG